ncbi:hypothetical protein EVA_10773 [gut metagenome]|uniref:Uncharacterized protein n=1 Tax=gut metagenome TaxID=749906 RepID=J9G2R4_9ZZZZ
MFLSIGLLHNLVCHISLQKTHFSLITHAEGRIQIQ